MEQLKNVNVSMNYNLRHPNKKGASVIYCILAVNGKQMKLPMGIKVNAYQWNKGLQLCTIGANMTDTDRQNNMAVNRVLNEVRFAYEETFTYFCNSEHDTTDFADTFKGKISEITFRTENDNNDMAKPKKTSKKIAGEFVEQLQGLVNEFSAGRQNKYKKVVDELLAYMERKHIPMMWQSINIDMLYNFMASQVSAKPMQIRYYNDNIMNIYALLDHADNHDYLKGTNYNKTKWLKILGKQQDTRNIEERQSTYVVLEQEQLNELSTHDFKDGVKNEVRDIFTFLCYTGLAVGDMLQIWNNDFATWYDGNNIEIKRNKTEKPCMIPMHHVKHLYERYKSGFSNTNIKGKLENGKLSLKTEENRILNLTLHEICKEVGLTDEVEITRSFVGCENGRITIKNQKEMRPMYEEITMYDSRHTFITIAYYDGMSKEQIADIVGHGSNEMINKIYLKLDQQKERAAKAKRNNEFYSKSVSEINVTTATTENDTDAIKSEQKRLKNDNETMMALKAIDPKSPTRSIEVVGILLNAGYRALAQMHGTMIHNKN